MSDLQTVVDYVLGTGLDQDYTSGEMVMFRCHNGLSVTVRTSGTEPKLKYYSELVCDADTDRMIKRNTTLLLAQQGKLPLFAFEEAIGYMCNHRVPDKDGVSAAVQVASLASHLYSSGSSLLKQLNTLYSQYGYHVTHNAYFICHESSVMQNIFRRIRNYHGHGQYPKKVGSCEITYIRDFTAGVKIPETVVGEQHLSKY
ncbi:glucose 1,6-bisphosphate synthase [Ostrinia furnacalis]|uniref:glucose 1,6-bisphosphate synthase n=1 Tax=Ostrinia furnacalis TaxID=93504 RepID=UPI00103E03A4|nr:glucose 1,6-bisphosphate synthase [Ostrinia furnacalis]